MPRLGLCGRDDHHHADRPVSGTAPAGNFVIWGGYHGVLLALARIVGITRRRRRRARRWLSPLQIAGCSCSPTSEAVLQGNRSRPTCPPPRPVAVPVDRLGRIPAPTFSSSRCFTRSRCGFRVSGRNSAAATSWRRMGGRGGTTGGLGRGRPGAAGGPAFAGILVLRSTTSLDFIYFRF